MKKSSAHSAQSVQLMGILNLTPDSFYPKSRYIDPEAAIAAGLKMVEEGADILDLGAESSRPGALSISESEEIDRLLPILKALKNQISIPISVDTIKPKVAALALEAGASILNDITGFQNPAMREVAAQFQPEIVVMHMQGQPQTMQEQPHYTDGLTATLLAWFEQQIDLLLNAGIKKEKIILDPGFGFGKTIAHNLEIIENLRRFSSLGFRVLVGVSRKFFIRTLMKKSVEDVLPATLVVNALAIQRGASIIRVHDVNEHRQVIDILRACFQIAN